MKAETKDYLFLWVLLATFVVCIFGGVGLEKATAHMEYAKTTPHEYPLYQNDASIQLPVMFALNHDLVSEKADMFGYCLSVPNRDVECYTMNGRFLGVGSVELYSDGNLSAVHVIDRAPEQYRRVMTNAFLRVWG